MTGNLKIICEKMIFNNKKIVPGYKVEWLDNNVR